jgi:hypothetical protein
MQMSTATQAPARPAEHPAKAPARPTAPAAVTPPPLPKSRPPTRTVAPPCILLAGGESTGKSTTAAMLTASDKVGQSWWLELGETTADEYALLKVDDKPVRYQPLVHDGSYAAIMDRVTEVRNYARWVQETGAEKPVVLVFDGMSAEWDGTHDYVNARHRASKANQKILAADPNAELTKPGRHLWNDANDRHNRLMTLLLTFPGIVIMTARAGEVSDTDPATGQPYRDGRKIWRVDAQFNIKFQARCTIRLDRGEDAQIVACKSVAPELRVLPWDPPQKLPRGWTLEKLIFDMWGYNPATSGARELISPVTDLTPEDVRNEVLRPETTYERCRELYRIADRNKWGSVELANEGGEEENLLAMIRRQGESRNQPGPGGRPAAPATAEGAAVRQGEAA